MSDKQGPRRVLVIEDTVDNAKRAWEAAKALGLPMCWLRFDNHRSKDERPPQAWVAELSAYLHTKDIGAARAMIAQYVGDTLVLLDWQLGTTGELEVVDAVTDLVDRSLEIGQLTYVQAYSIDKQGAVTEDRIRRRGHTSFILRTERMTTTEILREGVKRWRDADEKIMPLPARLWPDEVSNCFTSAHDAIKHGYTECKPEDWRPAMKRYLSTIVGPHMPDRWFEDKEAPFLHESVKTLMGAHSRMHLGRRVALEQPVDEVAEKKADRGIRFGTLVLLLAAATAPNNEWIKYWEWTDACTRKELTETQIPLQAYYAAVALVRDTKEHADEFENMEGLFVRLRFPDGRRDESCVESVSLKNDVLAMTLRFSSTRSKSGDDDSLQDILHYAGKSGDFLAAFRKARDALSRSKKGYEPKCAFRLRPDMQNSGMTNLSIRYIE